MACEVSTSPSSPTSSSPSSSSLNESNSTHEKKEQYTSENDDNPSRTNTASTGMPISTTVEHSKDNPPNNHKNQETNLNINLQRVTSTSSGPISLSSTPVEFSATNSSMRKRRSQRCKESSWLSKSIGKNSTIATTKARKHYGGGSGGSLKDGKKSGGGVEALVPSAIGVAILVVGIMGKMGFRGRATVAGIDLGTTNSVVCVQAPAKGVGVIDCLKDPATGSPIIPSVVSFLEPHERFGSSGNSRNHQQSQSSTTLLDPPPSAVVVGSAAKRRITSHPHHTLYHAKRVLGKTSLSDPAVQILQNEVEFGIVDSHLMPETNESTVPETIISTNNHPSDGGVYFTVPDTPKPISPVQVGAYVVHHLKTIMDIGLGHSNVRSAVICVPAKFNAVQRQLTVDAFSMAGIKVVRIVEEPTAAALAYGLHKKPGVDYIVVYDFGGGTLDVSVLYVTAGFVDVMGSDGDDALGGTDFDIAVAQFLLLQRGGQGIVHTTSAALKQLLLQHTTDELPDSAAIPTDLEEVLARSCSKLQQTPMCTLSSFHAIGEQIKIDLSNQYYEQQIPIEATGQNQQSSTSVPTIMATASCFGLISPIGTSAPISINEFCNRLEKVDYNMTVHEFDVVTRPLFDRSILPVERLLSALDLDRSNVDEIVMVGGTTRMPQIRHLVRDYMQVQHLHTSIDPDLTVAYGAAIVID